MNDKTGDDASTVYEDLDYVDLMDLYEDAVDPRTPWCLGGYPRRNQFVSGLRQLADLLDSRPDLPIPKDGSMRLDVIGSDDRRVAEITFGPVGYRFAALPAASEQTVDPQDVSRSAARLAANDTLTSSRHSSPGSNPLAAAASNRRAQRADARPGRHAR